MSVCLLSLLASSKRVRAFLYCPEFSAFSPNKILAVAAAASPAGPILPSSLQSSEQLSPLLVLPSSHSSLLLFCTMPSPQTASWHLLEQASALFLFLSSQASPR